MAVTAKKKPVPVKPPDRSAETMEVIEVTRGYLDELPNSAIVGSRTWASLLTAADVDARVRVRQVLRGDNSCTYAWAYAPNHPQAPPRNVAWFREGREGQALLYQQGWRAIDPPDAPDVLVTEL